MQLYLWLNYCTESALAYWHMDLVKLRIIPMYLDRPFEKEVHISWGAQTSQFSKIIDIAKDMKYSKV